MVSFLKRRKSSAVGPSAERGAPSAVAPSDGTYERGQRRAAANTAGPVRPPKVELAMPDLRFSALNLDADMMSAAAGNGLERRGQGERPPSRQIQSPNQQHIHTYNPNERTPGQYQQRPPQNYTPPQSSAAMYAAIPLDLRSATPAQQRSLYAAPRAGVVPPKSQARPAPSGMPSASPSSPPKDKKQLKKDEKERAARERERSKHAAKEHKAVMKRGGDYPTSIPTSNVVERSQAPSQPAGNARRTITGDENGRDVRRELSTASQWTVMPDTQGHYAMRPVSQQPAPRSVQQPVRLPDPHPTPANVRMNVHSPDDSGSRQGPALNHKSPAVAQLPATTAGRSSKEAAMATSSSEGGNSSTSTADRIRPGSSETATSVEVDTKTASSSFITSDELSSSARSPVTSIHRVRPARDNEREERAQSRLSMTLDFEVARNAGDTPRSTAENSSNALSSLMSAQSSMITSPSQQSQQDRPPATDGSAIHSRSNSNASKLSTFSAMLMASRPGGAADRSVEQAQREAEAAARKEQMRQEYYRRAPQQQTSMMERSGLIGAGGADVKPTPMAGLRGPLTTLTSSQVKRIRESMPVTPPRRRVVQSGMQCSGEGWSCLGVGDHKPIDLHWRTVEETVRVAHVTSPRESEHGDEAVGGVYSHGRSDSGRQQVEYRDEVFETHYNDLFELLFTSTTPDVIARLLAHLDVSDVKALRHTSSAVRLAVGAQRENVLVQTLGGIGYKTWTHVRGSASAYRARVAGQLPTTATKDPCPLSLSDLEAYMIGHDLLPEYAVVGHEFARDPAAMDAGIAQLARATTRAHNRVLTRLRLQPVYKQPTTPSKKGAKGGAEAGANGSPSRPSMSPATTPNGKQIQRHNSYYAGPRRATDQSSSALPPLPLMGSGWITAKNTALIGSPSSTSSMDIGDITISSFPSPAVTTPSDDLSVAPPVAVSPWKPGRAAQFRVWVPTKDPSGWLSDEELATCEQELYRSGVWQYVKRGDIVWNTAVGDRMNEGKYVFDGHYLRDLSYAYDIGGHLPSWLNVVMFSPSYWHNVIKSTMPQPVVYLDITPWKDQILNSLRLVQDQVDTFSGNGARYRIAKWLYRTAANISVGQIISRMNDGLEIVDEGWHGRIVIETDGTAEMAKLLVARCAGAEASPAAKAQLLAAVMGDAAAAGKAVNVHDTNGMATLAQPVQYNKFGANSHAGSTLIRRGGQAQTSAWAIMRERSRPGLIWIRPLADRERVAQM